ncbi:MAG: energy-coupling factor ABC transporter ATP-binding protein [Spirochaetota bacterium]
MSLIELRQLSHIFPDGTTALRNVSLSIGEGEFAVISGKNGSGKTLLLRIMNGLIQPTSGTVLVNGYYASEDAYHVRRSLGLVFQQADHQIIGQSVSRDIAFGLENLGLHRGEITRRVNKSLELVGLQEHAEQRPRTLSGGEKRRLTIAGTAAMEPLAIAFDEPFTNLDYSGVLQVLNLLVTLHEGGHTIILVTHDLDKVLAHADRLILMDRGTIAADGRPSEVIDTAKQCGVRIPKGFRKQDIGSYSWLKD